MEPEWKRVARDIEARKKREQDAWSRLVRDTMAMLYNGQPNPPGPKPEKKKGAG